MDQAKLSKSKMGNLPLWVRIGNSISGIFEFFDLIGGVFGLVLMFMFGLIISPFIILYEIISYPFKRK